MSKKLSAKKIKGIYKDLLMHARKVRAYRRDLMAESVLSTLDSHIEALKAVANSKKGDMPNVASAEKEIEEIHTFLEKHGGKIYPRTLDIEFAEMALIAALVIIGIRTFFLQPFIIPTNSMYPTYNGMLPHVHQVDEIPNVFEKTFRLITRGARNKQVTAPTSGDIYIPIMGIDPKGNPVPFFKNVPGKSWFVFPAVKRRYYFAVGDTLTYVDVPGEFDGDDIYEPFIDGMARSESFRSSELGGVPFFKTTAYVEAGEPIVNFDILLGDALFVDRFSYHFIKPGVGDPFVFRTENIPALNQSQYYIKRLVGTGGDTLSIEEPVLYRNGEPIKGVDAFDRNHQREGEYEGYVSPPYDRKFPMPLAQGSTTRVDSDHFFAMGDNSDSSLDSRYWGDVPKESVVGRAFFIYFPFTNHWGPAE